MASEDEPLALRFIFPALGGNGGGRIRTCNEYSAMGFTNLPTPPGVHFVLGRTHPTCLAIKPYQG